MKNNISRRSRSSLKFIGIIISALIFVVNPSQVFAESNSNSYEPSISSDGRYVVFESDASNLVAGDTNESSDIFLRDNTLKTTTRISVDSDGLEGNSDSNYPSISSDGRYVVFESDASNLVAGDTNEERDIFLRDTTLGTTTRISVDSDGLEGNNSSDESSISSDGRYVVFDSYASNLVVGDTNGEADIFLRDTTLGTTTRISVDSDGLEGNDSSYEPSISSDGRYVVFDSSASNFVVGDTNGRRDIFLRDTTLGTTTRISVDSDGLQVNGSSDNPSISSDGRYVVFESRASNLIVGDTNVMIDIFLRDTTLGTTTRISVDSDGLESNGDSSYSSISSDGRYVVFDSWAPNLVAGDTNEERDIFLRDTTLGTTTRISVDSDGLEGDSGSDDRSSISSDGRYVVFDSDASNLVIGDTNESSDIFLRDTTLGTTTRISVPTNPSISYSGNFTETTANDGSLDGSRIATITKDTFVNSGSTLTLNTHYSLTNAPAGLTPVMTVDGDGLTATLTFTGNSTDHENADDVSNLTITFLDGAFTTTSATTDVVNYTNTAGTIDFENAPAVASSTSSGSSIHYGCKDIEASNYEYFSLHNQSLCEYKNTTTIKNTEIPVNSKQQCSESQILTQNLKAPSRNGEYNSYTKAIVSEAHILQGHLNRLGFNSGLEDGSIGPITSGAIKRMQESFGVKVDGFVGPVTRGLINESCVKG